MKGIKTIGYSIATLALVMTTFMVTGGIAHAQPGDIENFVAENTIDVTESSMFDLSEPDHVYEVLVFLTNQIATFRSQLTNGIGGIGGDGGPLDGIVEALKVGNNEMSEFVIE